MLFGLASVANAVSGEPVLAAWLITWAVLTDKLDGTMARLFGASSRFGTEFDSFADFVAFGIAPATLFYVEVGALADWQGPKHHLLAACCALFVLAAAVRLARFNITQPPGADTYFYGLPTTLS